jgi:formate dehydrogenase major subunit
VRSPHIEASHHLPLRPGTNVAVLTALAHVIVTEGLIDEAFIRERCDWDEFQDYAASSPIPRHSPEATESTPACRRKNCAARRGSMRRGGNGAIYYGLGVTEHSQGSTTVMAIANLAMLTGNIGRPGVGVNPLRGQNNVQGSCDMGSFPHELPGYRHVKARKCATIFEKLWGVELESEPGLRIPTCWMPPSTAPSRASTSRARTSCSPTPTPSTSRRGSRRWNASIVHDLFLNETANYAHVFLPGSTFLEKDGTFTNAERRINRVRKVMTPKNGYADWEVTQCSPMPWGSTGYYNHPSEIMDEIAATTPSFAECDLRAAGREGLGAVALQRGQAGRHAGHACRWLRARQGQVHPHRICRDRREDRPALPAAC